MQNKPADHYLFLINKQSGPANNPDWERVLREKFSASSLSYQVIYLPATFEPKEIRKQVQQIRPGVLVAAGGDGTVAMTATIATDLNITLGILPQGSANGMATELGIPADLDKALDILLQQHSSSCDLIDIAGIGYCIHMADAGLNARLVKHFEAGNMRGMLGYAKVIMKTMVSKRKLTVRLSTETDTITTDAFMVVLANARKYGTGAVINPEGSVQDGYFEVVVVKRLNFGALLRMLIKPGLFNPQKIEIFKVKQVQVNSNKPMDFQVDGEYKGKVKEISASIVPAALQVLIPRPMP